VFVTTIGKRVQITGKIKRYCKDITLLKPIILKQHIISLIRVYFSKDNKMKISKLPFLAGLTGLMLVISSVNALHASEGANERQVFQVTNIKSTNVLNVRQKPSTNSSVILQIPADAKWILKRTSERKGNWQKVLWGVKEGWVYNRYLGSDAKATQALAKHRQCIKSNPGNSMCCGYTGGSSKSRNDNSIQAFKVVRVGRGQSLNVRASGNANAKRITNIPHNATGIIKFPGQQVRRGNAVWQKVRWNGRDGWVNASFLKYDPIISDYRNIVYQTC